MQPIAASVQHGDPRSTTQPRRWAPLVAVALPMAPLACLAVAAEGPLGLVIPILGPWAGVALGHWDCTMANQLPTISWAIAAAGFAAGAWVAAATRSVQRSVGLILLAAWSIAWCALALLSLINASS